MAAARHVAIDGKDEVINFDGVFASDGDGMKPSNKPTGFSAFPMGADVSQLFLAAGKQHAERAISAYGNIDILRPYFHVEPQEVRDRMIDSMVPRVPSRYQALVLPSELYGPLMLVLTLVSLLLAGMKTSGHTVKEGTLMGTAFGVCFGYWLGGSSLVHLIAYISNSHLTYVQTLSLMGYALTGHCVTLLLSLIFHPIHSHLFFYLIWAIFGGASAAKLVSVLWAKTEKPAEKLRVCAVAASLHLLMLLYFHFAYHATVEALDLI